MPMLSDPVVTGVSHGNLFCDMGVSHGEIAGIALPTQNFFGKHLPRERGSQSGGVFSC